MGVSGDSAETDFACCDGDVVAYWQAAVESRFKGFDRPPSEKEKVRIMKALVRLRVGFVQSADPDVRELHGLRDTFYNGQALAEFDKRFLQGLGIAHVE